MLDLIDSACSATDEPSTPPQHGQLIGLSDRSDFWAVGASSWADINKLDLLTNIPWIATLEEQDEDNLHLVLRKTPPSRC
jgi:hypothetical protein